MPATDPASPLGLLLTAQQAFHDAHEAAKSARANVMAVNADVDAAEAVAANAGVVRF